VRPLHFDYSRPVAVAWVDLHDPLPPASLLERVARTLGYAPTTSALLHSESWGQEDMLNFPPHNDVFEAHAGDDSSLAGGGIGATYVAAMGPDDGGLGAAPLRRSQRQQGSQRKLRRAKPLSLAQRRPLQPGQVASVSVRLDLPPGHIDLFQVIKSLHFKP
jgi:hypothetical protein